MPRQVGIKFATADAAEADLKASGIRFDLVPTLDLGRAALLRYSTSENVAAFLQTLTKRGAITQAPVITTTNNVAATITLSTTLSSQAVLSETFAVTPRVNSNDSVTLDLHLVLLNGTAKREMKTLRTVKSGDTMVIVMPPIGSAAGKSFLLFVTPAIISTDKGPATMMVKSHRIGPAHRRGEPCVRPCSPCAIFLAFSHLTDPMHREHALPNHLHPPPRVLLRVRNCRVRVAPPVDLVEDEHFFFGARP